MATVIVAPFDLFTIEANLIVIPVNCRGVMGKGLAKEAERRYPAAAAFYKRKCAIKELRPGEVTGYFEQGNIGFAATKDDWRMPSRGSWVLSCAERLVYGWAPVSGTFKIAVPALGCGLGGLDWNDFGRAIESTLKLGPEETTFYLSPPR